LPVGSVNLYGDTEEESLISKRYLLIRDAAINEKASVYFCLCLFVDVFDAFEYT
jgi:hypothetical protein